MKLFLSLSVIFFTALVLVAQERYVKPADEASQDPSFLKFRSEVIAAVKRRDVKFVMNIVPKDIESNFGGENGYRYFKNTWRLENPKSAFWDEFLKILGNGGHFVTEGNRKFFVAPYTANGFPTDIADFDVFTYGAIVGTDVNLRRAPNTRSEVVAKLSYNVVIIDFENSATKGGRNDEYSWLRVKTLGGMTGFVSAQFVGGPADLRAGFEKRNGRWMLVFFVEGD